MAKKYKARPINGGKKDFVSRDTHAVTLFSFFFFPSAFSRPPSLSLSFSCSLSSSLSLSFFLSSREDHSFDELSMEIAGVLREIGSDSISRACLRA